MEDFKAQCAMQDIEVHDVYWSLSYSQSDSASFDGRVNLWSWMENNKEGDQTYAEKYPALYLACVEDGSFAQIDSKTSGRYYQTLSIRESWYAVHPQGVFTGLDDASWDQLIDEQAAAADLDKAIREYVKGLCQELYRDLQKEYEYATSEDAFIEHCDCNEITFEVEE